MNKKEWTITPSEFYREALVQPPGHFRNQAVRFGKQMKYMEKDLIDEKLHSSGLIDVIAGFKFEHEQYTGECFACAERVDEDSKGHNPECSVIALLKVHTEKSK
ncbi:MAG TPA: hypothetical protein VMV86_03615 [Methanosarcinales archaeon]|nr:hypothetical protein [Methanosarcinales archaeon]